MSTGNQSVLEDEQTGKAITSEMLITILIIAIKEGRKRRYRIRTIPLHGMMCVALYAFISL